MSMLEEIGVRLQQETSLGLQANVNLFFAQRPDDVDECVTLYEYSGPAPEYDISSSSPEWEMPHLQIVARSFDPRRARDQLRAAYLVLASVCRQGNAWLLDNLDSTVARRTQYLRLTPLQQPFQIGYDENRRALWAVNFQIQRRPQSE